MAMSFVHPLVIWMQSQSSPIQNLINTCRPSHPSATVNWTPPWLTHIIRTTSSIVVARLNVTPPFQIWRAHTIRCAVIQLATLSCQCQLYRALLLRIAITNLGSRFQSSRVHISLMRKANQCSMQKLQHPAYHQTLPL